MHGPIGGAEARKEPKRRGVHAAALRLLHLRPSERPAVVKRMFLEDRRDTVGFWLLTLVSTGIATLGLALGSTAVVIGAMLIAPVMGPIVELGMALVVGSPALTVRSLFRVLGSFVAVAGGAALLTLVLPFHQVTAEIAARTAPTTLDLLIAILVAVAAAFTTVRGSSATASAAAGTAIGIALVPPLCTLGFGLGVRDASIASGAALLFLTDFTAILFVSAASFWLLGFETIDATEWEDAALAEERPGGPMHRAMARVRTIFASRYGRLLRISLPIVLVAALLYPLGAALAEVAWEVRSRAAITSLIAEATGRHPAVQTTVAVKSHRVTVDVYVVAAPGQAQAMEDWLGSRIAAATHVVPTVTVMAVADVDALRGAVQAAVPAAAGAAGAAPLAELRRRVDGALRQQWPVRSLGRVQAWTLSVDSGMVRVDVAYWGRAADSAAAEVLGRGLSARTGDSVAVGLRSLDSTAISAPFGSGVDWLPALAGAAAVVAAVPGTAACVGLPARDTAGPLHRAAGTILASAPPTRVTVATDTAWTVRLLPHPCIPPPSDTTQAPPP